MQVPLSLLFVDPDRFQNRVDAFSELSADAVAQHYDPNKFDPVVIWADPQRGRTFVLSGHSRLEGMRRRGAATVAARYFAGTEAEAIQFARVDANRATTAENLVEDLTAYRLMRDGDEARALKPAKKAELNRAFKGKTAKLEAWSRLQPGGLFLNALGQDDRSQFPYLEKFALWVGQLRAKEADLTNTHEADCFNFLYADTKNQRLTREEFDELVTRRLAWGKPRLFPECDRGGCTDLKDLARRGPQAESYRDIEALAKYRETITQRLRSTDRSLRVYTEPEREKLKEQGQLIDLELKRLRRDLNQAEDAPGLFGPSFAGTMREFIFYEDERGRAPVEEFIEKLPRKEQRQLLTKLAVMAEFPHLQEPQYKRFTGYPFDFGELRPGNFRIFVHRVREGVYLLLHAFRKKSDETPAKEINLATKRVFNYMSRQDYGKETN